MHSKSQNNSNHPSLLLNQQQNNLVFSLLGKRCYTLATAVVQLVLTEPNLLNKWSLKTTGVVCFVKDHPRKSYFIKVYDCDNRRLTWQQEIYPAFEYKTPRPYFHTFEAHDCIVGLNFASEQEAQVFKDTILGKLRDRERRTDRLRAAHVTTNGHGQPSSANSVRNNNGQLLDQSHHQHHHHHRHNNDDNHNSTNSASIPTTVPLVTVTNHNQLSNGFNMGYSSGHKEQPYGNQHRLPHTVSARMQPTQTGAAASIPISTMQKSQSALLGNNTSNINLSMSANIIKSEKKKLNKRDIGLPTNFQHVTHVGFSPQTGFDLDNVNPSMKKDLQLLFDSGADAQQQHQTTPQSPPVLPPPPPPRPLPPAPSNARRDTQQVPLQSPPVPPPPPPPPPPSLPPMVSALTPPKPPPLQTTPSTGGPPKPPPLPSGPLVAEIPKPPPLPSGPLTGGPPKPPPLPTTPLTRNLPKPPPLPATSTGAQPKQAVPDLNIHAALMNQVLQGKQLNHVDTTKPTAKSATPAPADDPRSALMNQIKAGVKLRSANRSKPDKPEQVAPPVGGLAGALAKALQERGKVLHHSSSENEDEADEWDE